MFPYDVDFLINNGLMDAYFPYPLAFTTMFNAYVFILLLFFALFVFLIFKMVLRWLMSSVG